MHRPDAEQISAYLVSFACISRCRFYGFSVAFLRILECLANFERHNNRKRVSNSSIRGQAFSGTIARLRCAGVTPRYGSFNSPVYFFDLPPIYLRTNSAHADESRRGLNSYTYMMQILQATAARLQLVTVCGNGCCLEGVHCALHITWILVEVDELLPHALAFSSAEF